MPRHIQEPAVIPAADGKRVCYSCPHSAGAEYVSVCNPALTLDTVHRDS